MILAVTLSLLALAPAPAPAPAAPAAARSDDPPIKVWLNQDNYFQRGDKARVHVKLAEDGYLVVLRADAEGRVRMLFPLDPTDDDFARGGQTLEIRGRGDREAFYIDEREGAGVVLAARSAAPFKFDEFVRGDHWDYRVLDARQAGDDKEAALVDIVQRMTPDGHFDYDAQKYFVASPRAYRESYYPGYSSFGLGLGYGWGWPYSSFAFSFGYGSCFDPFFYDPFFCGASFYSPFFYRPFFYGAFVYRPFFYRPYYFTPVYRPWFYQPYAYYPRRRFAATTGVQLGGTYFTGRTGTGIGPRLRIPQGTLLTGGTSRGIGVRARDASGSRRPARVESFPMRVRDDRPASRVTPSAQPSDRRDGGGSRGIDRPAPSPSRGRDPGFSGGGRSSGGRSWSSPRPSGGGRSAPANRGGGGGGGGRSGGGGGGGGPRRR